MNKLILVLSLFTASCTQVPIKDEIFYGNKGMAGAVQFHSLKPGQVDLTFEEWMKLIRTKPLICSSVDAYGDMKAAFEKICSSCNCCTPDTVAAVDSFFTKVQNSTKGK